MTKDECLEKLISYYAEAGIKVSREKLEAYAKRLDGINVSSLSKAEFFSKAQEMFDSDVKRIDLANKVERASNAAKVISASQGVIQGKMGGKGEVENLLNWHTGGAIKPGENGRKRISSLSATVSSQLRDFWNQGIEPYKDLVKSNLLVDEIFQERWAIQKGLEIGKSGSKEAVEIAKVLNASNQKAFNLNKSVSPHLQANEDFITNQMWNREKVSSTSKEEWVSKAIERNGKYSFPEASPSEKNKIFGNVYDRIKAGVFGTVLDSEDVPKYQSGSLSKRVSQHRKIIPNDWQAAADNFKDFGHETISDLMDTVINRTGRNYAINEKYGTTPRANAEEVFNRAYSKASPDGQRELRAAKPSIDAAFRTSVGESDVPANNMLGKFTQGAQNIIYSAKTGSSYLSMIPDLGTAAGTIRGLNGKSIIENASSLFDNYSKAFASTAYREEALKKLLVFSHSAKNNIMGGLGAPGVNGGILGNISEKIGEWGQHQRHVDSMKTSTASVLARDMGLMSEKSFSELPNQSQLGLPNYGIQEPEWDFMRKQAAPWSDKEPGFSDKFITPENILTSSDEDVLAYMKQKGLKSTSPESIYLTRQKMAFDYGAMLNDHADYGSTTGTERQRAFMYGGREINTPEGAVRRALFMFKSAAISQYDNYRRLYYSGGGKGLKGDWNGVAMTLAITSFWTTMGIYAKGALEGKTPEDPTNPEFMARVFLQSGGAGLMGDPLIAAMQKEGVGNSGTGALLSLAGPFASEGAKAIGLTKEYAQTAVQQYSGTKLSKYPNRQLYDFITGNIPGQNLLGVKGALQYYVHNGMREYLDTGYIGRLENQVNQTKGLLDDRQKYFFWQPSK